jgi:hypothetical protein
MLRLRLAAMMAEADDAGREDGWSDEATHWRPYLLSASRWQGDHAPCLNPIHGIRPGLRMCGGCGWRCER